MDIDPDYVRMDPKELQIREPFSKIFRIKEAMRKTIANSMRVDGYDATQPIVVWRQENVVIDGHTRRQSAIDAGIEVWACFRDFKDEDEAFDYAVARQRDRRNLTPDELLSLVAAIRKRKQAGRPTGKKLPSSEGNSRNPTSAAETAAIIGCSTTTVERALAILDHAENTGDTREMDAVREGSMSLDKAATAVRNKKREANNALYAAVADLLVGLDYNAKTAPHSEKDRKAFIAKYGLMDGILKKPFSNGTLQRAYQYLGWSKAPRKKSLRERDKKTYDSVTISNGHATALGIRIMERPVEAADEAWLESLRLRASVRNKRMFDDDALIVRHCKPLLQQIKQEIEKRIGLRSEVGMTPLHRAIHRVFDIHGPETWRTCDRCGGGGRDKDRTCRVCGGVGYVIPGFTKEMR